MKQKTKKNRGFTLIELMVVIAIIGILAAVLVPSYNSFVTRSKRSANEQELLEIKKLMDTAILTQDSYSITIDEATGAQNVSFINYSQFADAQIVKQFYEQETGDTMDEEIVVYVEEGIMYYVFRGQETRYDLSQQSFLNYQ